MEEPEHSCGWCASVDWPGVVSWPVRAYHQLRRLGTKYAACTPWDGRGETCVREVKGWVGWNPPPRRLSSVVEQADAANVDYQWMDVVIPPGAASENSQSRSLAAWHPRIGRREDIGFWAMAEESAFLALRPAMPLL